MCGRILQAMSPAQIAEYFGVEGPITDADPAFNGAPSEMLLVIRWNPETKKRTLDRLKWGLIPSWMKAEDGGPKPINAMCETIDEKPMFRDAFKKRRCLIPVTAFFEWRGIKPPKQPYAIARDDRAPFALAGLWENWFSHELGDWLRTFTIITCPANELVSKIHHRMPVIVPGDAYGLWLGERPATPDVLKAMLKPFPAELMTMWAIDRKMSNARHKDPDVARPVDDPMGTL